MASFNCISLFIISLIFVFGAVQSRLISLNTSDDQFVSDGLTNNFAPAPTPKTTCEHAYGFLPCADNLGGFLFQVILFQYLLFIGGQLVIDGSTKLFTLLGTGVFGASIFRVLLGLPRIIFLVVSGIFATKGRAKQMVTLGVMVYAGSTVLCLSFLWGLCLVIGRTKLNNETNTPTTNHHVNDNSSSSLQDCLIDGETCSNLKDTGVHTDEKTTRMAGMMLISLIPYVILLVLDVFDMSSDGKHIVVVTALVVSTLLLLAYFTYQIINPWIQASSLDYCQYDTLAKDFLRYALKHTQGKIVDGNGQPDLQAIEGYFHEVDTNNDKMISCDEFKSAWRTIEGRDGPEGDNEAMLQMINALDTSGDRQISLKEFCEGIMELRKYVTDTDENAAGGSSFMGKVWNLSKPILEIIFGVILMTFLSRPFMESVVQFSNSIGISTFFIAFIIIPIIINARRGIAAFFPASQQTKTSASLTFSQIYGEVIINNVMGLTALLAIVWAKDLTWDFSAEVFIVFVICAIVGLIGFRLTTYPLWTCILAFFTYFFSIALYYVLTFYLGW